MPKKSLAERNEIGDELEVEIVKKVVLPAILPQGLKSKHNPESEGGPDFLILDDNRVTLVIECKNWDDYTPYDYTIKNEILARFKGYTNDQLKLLVGHVGFNKVQLKKYINKNDIIYYDLGKQILPDDDELTKKEFAEKLKSLIALGIVAATGKFRDDYFSPMKMTAIGSEEVVFEHNSIKNYVNLRIKKEVWAKTSSGSLISEAIRVGPKSLDIVNIIRGTGGIHTIIIPRVYEIRSGDNVIVFLPDEYSDMGSQQEVRDFWLNKFFKQVLLRNKT
jgi:hypothetical protein